MTAKTKNKKAPQRLQDLRGGTINCLACEQHRPKEGAQPFRAHWVCANCSAKLQKAPTP